MSVCSDKLSLRLKSPSSLSLLSREVPQSLIIKDRYVLVCRAGKPSTADVPQQGWVEGQDHVPDLLAVLFPVQPRTLLAHGQPVEPGAPGSSPGMLSHWLTMISPWWIRVSYSSSPAFPPRILRWESGWAVPTCPGLEVRLAVLQFPASSSLPFVRIEVTLAFLQSSGTSYFPGASKDDGEWISNNIWQLPEHFVAASYWGPWIWGCQVWLSDL